MCEYNVDECKEDPCQNGGVCIDQVGSYYCKCLPGYEGKFMIIDFNMNLLNKSHNYLIHLTWEINSKFDYFYLKSPKPASL